MSPGVEGSELSHHIIYCIYCKSFFFFLKDKGERTWFQWGTGERRGFATPWERRVKVQRREWQQVAWEATWSGVRWTEAADAWPQAFQGPATWTLCSGPSSLPLGPVQSGARASCLKAMWLVLCYVLAMVKYLVRRQGWQRKESHCKGRGFLPCSVIGILTQTLMDGILLSALALRQTSNKSKEMTLGKHIICPL